MLYQVLDNPIFQNKKSNSNWTLFIDDLPEKDIEKLVFYEDSELEFQDSDMESMELMESDFEYCGNDKFREFSGIDGRIPSITVVEKFDSSESESESAFELESELELELESESESDFENPDSDWKHQKINSIPSSIRIIELDSDSETDLEFQEFLETDSNSGLDSNDNFQDNSISWEDISSDLESGSEPEQVERKIKGQETETCFDEENSKHLMTVVNTKEDFESIKIKIELHGHSFKEDDLNIELKGKTTLIVSLEDTDNKFERYFNLPNQCKMDKIRSKFSIWHKGGQTIQTLHIKIPKEKVQQISLENSSNMPITIVEEYFE